MAQSSNNAAIDVNVETTKTIDTPVDNTENVWASLEPFAGDVAREYARQAKVSAEAAADSQSKAAASETAAAQSASSAHSSETNAQDSEASAQSSANAAAQSATKAKTSETNAKASETSAAASASSAGTSASQASASATTASSSANAAKASQNAAKTSETNAKTSETNAANSAKQAADSATQAHTYATNAGNSATSAGSSASAASASASAAKTSETNAAQSAAKAEQVAGSIGNPVTGVTEVNGKVTVTKSNGEKNEFFAGLNMLQRNKAYAVGDIAYSPNLPSWAYLECTIAGITGSTEPSFSSVVGGATVNDGTATFILRDSRLKALVDFLFPVGTIIARDSDDRPEFLNYGKWEQIAPDRVLQGFKEGGTPVGSDVEAGLPNITGILYQGYGSENDIGLHGRKANPTGAFYKAETNKRQAPSTDGYSGAYTPGFDASRSNPIYGNSDTVQPKAHIVIYWKRIEQRKEKQWQSLIIG